MNSARPLGVTAMMLIAGIAALALASQVILPLDPVPITGQTLAVTTIGALYGWRFGAATIVLWLALAAAGAPLLAGGVGGLERFTGASGAYLFAFPFAAALVGWLGERGWNERFRWVLGAMLAANALCLAVGAARLAVFVGAAGALAKDGLPFVPGALLKSLAGAVLVRLIWSRIARPAG